MKQISLEINDLNKYCPKPEEKLFLRKDVEKDWKLEKKMLSNIKLILADYFIVQDIDIDMNEGNDFLILTVKPFKVGVRLRRNFYFSQESKRWKSTINNRYYDNYPREEFTVRYQRPTGIKTEYQKIIDGFVDYFLYGFLDLEEKNIIQWFLGNLNIFRTIKPNPIDLRWNKNGDSQFAVFKLKDLPETFISDSFNLPKSQCQP